MSEERIDIVVSQRGAREVKRDLEGIGAGADASLPNIERLKKALQQIGSAASLGAGPADRLREAMGKVGVNANIGASGLLRMTTAINTVQSAMNAATMATRNLNAGLANAGRGAGGAIPPINNLGGALGGLGGAANNASASVLSLWESLLAYGVIRQVTGALAEAIDSWVMLSNKLRQVSTDNLNLIETQESVYESAQRTRSGLDDIATLYTRMSLATDTLNLSQREVMDITETVAMAMKLNGGSVQETTSAMRQLSQAFNKGKLDGDEFRSLMESAPQLQKLFSDSLGVTKGELMAMSSDGQLTVELLIQALKDGGEAIREDFAASLPTISEGFKAVDNAFTRFIGKLDEATGFSRGFYDAMVLLADNIDIVIGVLGTITIALGAAFGPAMVATLATFAASFLAALGPIGLVIAAVSAVAAGIYIWRGRMRNATEAAIEHRSIIDSVVSAYKNGDTAVGNWADRIEGASRTQIAAALAEANNILVDLRNNIELTGQEWGQIFADTNRADVGNSRGELETLVKLYRDGGVSAALFKGELERLGVAFPNIPDSLILSLQNYSDTTIVAEENAKKLQAAWNLMEGNLSAGAVDVAENLLGVTREIDTVIEKANNPPEVPDATLSAAQQLLATAEARALAENEALSATERNVVATKSLETAGYLAADAQEASLQVATSVEERLVAAIQAQGVFNRSDMSGALVKALGFAKQLLSIMRELSSLRAPTMPQPGRTNDPIPASFTTPTFATGGSFTVGGAGGVDSQLVQFMASPGERVSIGTAQENTRTSTSTSASGNVSDSFASALANIEAETDALRRNNLERKVQERLLQEVDRLRQQGANLAPIEIEQLEKAIRKMAELREQTTLFENAIERGMQAAESAFTDFIRTGQVDFGELISSMLTDIARLAAQQYIMKPLSNLLNTAVGGLFANGLGSFFGLGNVVGTAATGPAFATGGSFTVGGAGGVDSQLVQLRASPGERVNVSRAGQSSDGGSSGVTNIFNITTPDVKGFKASETQIAARMARLANRGTRNS